MSKRRQSTCSRASLIVLSSLIAYKSFGADASDCARAAAGLSKSVANVACVASTDLTTANSLTTPPDNSIPGLPPGAFTPRADALQPVSAAPAGRYSITKAVPGLQIVGTMADDDGARWVLRLPDQWNGRLVVAVAPGVNSEYASDIIMSDYLVQNAYAYASTNKGHLKNRPSTADDPLACPASPTGGPGASTFVRLYQGDLPQELAFAVWVTRTIETARLAKTALVARYGRQPVFTYLAGKSAGALTTRRVLETDPGEFDAGIDFAAPYMPALGDPRHAPVPIFNNLVGVFALAMKNFPKYSASGYNQRSEAWEILESVGMPPDIFGAPTVNSSRGSYLETHYNASWMGLQCGNVRASDSAYAGDIADYKYWERTHPPLSMKSLGAVGTTGYLKRPLISVHGTMDATAPILGSRLYRADVVAQGVMSLHRLYEIQNGTHRDNWKDPPTNFTVVEYVLPHFLEAFESLVTWVENGQVPPPSQCVAPGGRLLYNPSAAHCPGLLMP